MIEINGIAIDPQHYIDKWTNWALEATLATDEQVTKNVEWLYKKANLKKPKVVIFREWEDFHNYNWASVRDSVGDSVWASVRDSVRASVWASVRDSVWASVRDSVGAWHWADDMSFADVFVDTKVLSKEKAEELEKYKEIFSTQRLAVYTEKTCYVLVAPIIRRQDGQLHSDQLPAVQWGKTGLYYLDGVNLSKEMWEKILSKTMTFSEIMKIEISDQRTVALKYNPEAIIKENAKLVNKDDRNNELYLIENQEINKLTNFPKMYFLKMLCPTGRVFIEGVDPEKVKELGEDANALQAYALGLTKSEYVQLSLES